jgi:hypothetical protein
MPAARGLKRAFGPMLLLLVLMTPLSAWQGQTWSFAVSGDSRNCGDIVMPLIAASVLQNRAVFYWHLGDFRAMYGVDEDIGGGKTPADLKAYRGMAWGDFELHQLSPFGAVPVFLSRGNHDEARVKTLADYISEFSPWLDQPILREQRLRDDPADTTPHSYYHWIHGAVDFISLDNAVESTFEPRQVTWFESTLRRAAANAAIKTLVLGMHEALPDSLSAGHSMNETPSGTASGRRVYADLVQFRKNTRKQVYVLASHSHFYLTDNYNTPCRRQHPEQILPGWVIGTAGAVRYRLPVEHSVAKEAKTDVYGYLLGTVSEDGSVRFDFKQIDEDQVTPEIKQRYAKDLIHFCFAENRSNAVIGGPPQPPACPAD